jgi:hypothetical protein
MADTGKHQDLMRYDLLAQEALRGVVRQALKRAAAEGVPGEHHFYISFQTHGLGVEVPPDLSERYPEEMTIVLQHQFWDLRMDEEAGLISVGLSFGGVASTLVIPLAALTAFADPQVRYGLRFQVALPGDKPGQDDTPAAPGSETASDQPDVPDAPQVVSLDAFRRRTPPKE